LKESVDLVLKALNEGVGGEVFVRKMPAHTVGDLVEVMLESLPRGKQDKMVKNIGIRPGEKIHELLISRFEAHRTVEEDNYYIILPQIKIPAVERKYKNKSLLGNFRYGSDNTERLSRKRLKAILKKEGWL
jgi:FlaA1/EpsC-like NDP-sugar epimerase